MANATVTTIVPTELANAMRAYADSKDITIAALIRDALATKIGFDMAVLEAAKVKAEAERIARKEAAQKERQREIDLMAAFKARMKDGDIEALEALLK